MSETDMKNYKLPDEFKSVNEHTNWETENENESNKIKGVVIGIINSMPIKIWITVGFVIIMSLIGMVHTYLYIASNWVSLLLFWSVIVVFIVIKGIKLLIKKMM